MENPTASPSRQSEVDHWVDRMNSASSQQADRYWRNLISENLDLYMSTITERYNFRELESMAKHLSNEFYDLAKLFDIHGDQTIAAVIIEQRSLYCRASLVFLAMCQSLDRSINSWRSTHSQSTCILLSAKLSALKAKDKQYAIPRTAWNDDHIISHDDLDRLEPMKWLNSVLMDVFVSKLNVKFALPVYDQRVAFLDSTFTLHHILPATKSHDTLKNPAGSIRSKPLKALQHRFKDKGITLIFPLNVNNTHWLVGAIFRASSTIGIFDSLIGESSNQAYHKLAYENMKKVWKVLAEAWFKDLHVPDQEWKFVVHTKIPKQGNVSDCGVFAIMYMIHLGYSSQINQEQVPLAYRLPVHSENLAGMRLLLLEELGL
ncbi:hypothetical protein GGU10DRAFT_380919 [Lentinula aff. detonsa]|uniref:Ubiquitin-like protease family profile domain-containing protein n=1 Tax=Lentinula aff. detonsa TaxID=2804958 RepID=A0AA38KWE1_9AGAR|nr:hypothetical protein GGU10DRAFT_380919 [Lentinula aff. detonsa]